LVPLCIAAFSCASRTDGDIDQQLAQLHDASWQVRASAADALGRLRVERAVPLLREALADDSENVRAASATALGRLGARSALEEIRGLIRNDKYAEVVVQSLFALADLSGTAGLERPEDLDLLLERVGDDRYHVESAARRALFAIVGRDRLVAMIREDLQSGVAELRLRGSRIAGALDLPELSGWERERVADRDPGVRAYAYEAILGETRSDDLAVLRKGLSDDNSRVRLLSAMALQELADPSVVPDLEKVAGRDPFAAVREAAGEAVASILKIPGSALPALWHYERIDDRLVLGREGECTLTRTFTMSIDESPEGTDELSILLPRDFPRVDRVLDAQADPVDFTLEWKEGLRELVLEVSPIEAGTSATFTVVARSRRPVSAAGAEKVFVTYRPAPVQARVGVLHVSIASPSGEAATLDRTELSPGDLEGVVVRASVPTSELNLLEPPPRSYSRAGDLTKAAGVVAAILAALAATIVHLRRRHGGRADRAILVAVLTTGALLFLTPIIVEDNLPYYALARSAVFDGDLDRMNEYAEYNQTQAFAPDNREPQDPVFVSLSRTPALFAAHAIVRGVNALSPSQAPNGFSFPYLFLTAVGDFLAVLIGCLACFSLVTRRVGPRYALVSVLAVVGGTNLLLFAYAWTGSSFQPSFLLFALFLNHWDKTREARGAADWLVLGVLLGLLGITRTLNLGFAAIPLLDWSYDAVVHFKRGGLRALARHVGSGALLTLGMLLAFAPQLVVQRLVDHSWIVDTYGVGSGRFTGLREHLSDLFLSTSDGLLVSMPLLGLAFVGLVPLFRFDRRLATLVTATLTLQLLAIGSYEVYWGYFLYGTPYFAPCAPIFCLAMAGLYRAVQFRWPRWGTIALSAVAVLFVARNAWCVLRQVADKLIGEWQVDMGFAQVVHTLLMLDRKLDVDVMRYSSEFACLPRELVGALRVWDLGQLLAALAWVGLLLFPVLVAYRVSERLRRWASGVERKTRMRFVVSVCAVGWLSAMGWVMALGRNTDVDYEYRVKQGYERAEERAVERLGPDESHTWQFASSNPSDRFSVITFLDGAVQVPQGQRVATVEVTSDEQSFQYELRAGVDTADFAVERPESRGGSRHTSPLDRACYSFRVHDDSGHFYTARAYRSVFETPIASRKSSLKVTSALTSGAIDVVVTTSRERKLPPDRSRRRWIGSR
jgi:HEAT repeat protein